MVFEDRAYSFHMKNGTRSPHKEMCVFEFLCEKNFEKFWKCEKHILSIFVELLYQGVMECTEMLRGSIGMKFLLKTEGLCQCFHWEKVC